MIHNDSKLLLEEKMSDSSVKSKVLFYVIVAILGGFIHTFLGLLVVCMCIDDVGHTKVLNLVFLNGVKNISKSETI